MSGWNLPPGVTDRMIDDQIADDDAMFDEDEAPVAPQFPFWTVAIYLVDQAYGGPEEGGWWYQTGERIDHPLDGIPAEFTFNSFNPAAGKTAQQCAVEFAAQLQKLLDGGPNVGRRDISSVLSDGRYYAQVYNGHPPKHYPDRRPHYE